jgi:hypothetical protein
MLTALILLLAAANFEPEYENTAPPMDEAVVLLSGPTEESTVAPPLANSDAVPEGGQSTDETFEQNLDETQTSGIRVTSPYRIPLTILTAVVCGLLFLFFRQTE